ncbi:MAG: class I SAM-dependent methyltransferase, partial [Anaerolineae bacterium]
MRWWEEKTAQFLGPRVGRGQRPGHWPAANFTVDWFLRHIDMWNAYLAPWLEANPPRVMLEVGNYEGMSARWLLEHTRECPLHLVDPYPGPEYEAIRDRCQKNLLETGQGKRATMFRQRSKDFWDGLFWSYDFIYVDGNHSAATVELDVVNAWKKLAPRGIILLDDYYHEEDKEWDVEREVRAGVKAAMPQIEPPLGLERLGQCAMLRKP